MKTSREGHYFWEILSSIFLLNYPDGRAAFFLTTFLPTGPEVETEDVYEVVNF